MNVETKAAQTAQLAGLHEKGAPPSVHEKFAAFWWGEWNEDVPGWLNLRLVAPDPVAKYLYQFSHAGDMAGPEAVKALESWCARHGR